MAKNALLLLADGFEEIEAITPIDVLRRAGINVTVAGLSSLHVTGSHHIPLTADIILRDAAGEYDALIVPGGPGADRLGASTAVTELVKKMYGQGKIIAAICAAPAVVLAPTGILSGKKATCFPGMEKELGAQVTFIREPVVIDGTIITSRGAGTAMEFALTLVRILAGPSQEKTLRERLVVSR